MKHACILLLHLPVFVVAQTRTDSLPAPRTKQLNEVVVSAPKPLYQQKPYGATINVQNSILTVGSSALEVLGRTPGITLDHQHNTISLNGRTGVTIMLNGKLMRMSSAQLFTLLDGMSANDIEKIELLTSPPANYDAEGNAGIISIVMKQPKTPGTKGYFSLSGGYNKYTKEMGSASITHQTSKVKLMLAYAFEHHHDYSRLMSYGSENVPVLGGPTVFSFNSANHTLYTSHDINASIDLQLKNHWTIGTGLDYTLSRSNANALTDATYNVLPDSLFTFNGNVRRKAVWDNYDQDIHLTHKDFSVSAEYMRSTNNSPTQVQSEMKNNHGQIDSSAQFAPDQRGVANSLLQVGVFKIDDAKQLNGQLKLEFGAKGTYTNSNTLSGIQGYEDGKWIQREDLADRTQMWEGIGAAYTSLTWKIDTATTVMVGLRDEYYHTHVSTPATLLVNREFNKLYPSLFFSHSLNDVSGIQLAYTRRITRPSPDDLSPIASYIDPLAVGIGNPALKPTITDQVRMGYHYGDYAFGLILSHDDNAMVRYQITASPSKDLVYIGPQNLDWYNSISLEANLPLQVTSWWRMNYHIIGGWRQYKMSYSVTPVTNTFWAGVFNGTEEFTLHGKYSVELAGWWQTRGYNGAGQDGRMTALDIGVKKALGKGSIQFTVNDVFLGSFYHGKVGTVSKDFFNSSTTVTYEGTPHFPGLKLSYTYKFN
jgi:iron complex outermembrane recepter protein